VSLRQDASSIFSTVRRALPMSLTIIGLALLCIAALDWVDYTAFLVSLAWS